MKRVPIGFLATALLLSTVAVAAEQNGQNAGKPDTVRSAAKPVTGKDCAKLAGEEKDKCIQATPAGPVDMQTGSERKGESDIAKQRDRENETTQDATDAPAQGNDAVGHPKERTATGEAQTGTDSAKQGAAAKSPPQQSKDTVGHPEARGTTGEAQSGQEPGQGIARKTQ